MTLNEPIELAFAGHETFPLRQQWLKKSVDHVNKAEQDARSDHCFDSDSEDVIIELGVGKNMVKAMRFWALATGFVEKKPEKKSELQVTGIGNLIFNDADGLDPYGENPATTWLVHWNLASRPDRLTVFWYLFNKVNRSTVTRTQLLEQIFEFAQGRSKRVTENTIKRDIEVCFRSYVPSFGARSKKTTEEIVEPMLSDLGILNSLSRDEVELYRSRRPTLPAELFIYAVMDYWNQRADQSSTLDFIHLNDIGAPGRVFKLSEPAVYDYLERLEELTDGALAWTEQAGVRCIGRQKKALTDREGFMRDMLKRAYGNKTEGNI